MSYATFPRPFYILITVALTAMLLLSCSDNSSAPDDDNNPPPSSEADVTITIDNVGSSAWEVTDIEGDEDVAEENENNTRLTLAPNLRYRIVNNGGATAHPFGMQDAGDTYLLAQSDRDGSFESDASVDFVSDSEGITFTLTPALAAEINSYNCEIHVAMEGSVSIR